MFLLNSLINSLLLLPRLGSVSAFLQCSSPTFFQSQRGWRNEGNTRCQSAQILSNKNYNCLWASSSDIQESLTAASAVVASSSSTTTTTTTTTTNNEPVSFVSPRYQCYIEDTDSYGVMYNANYLRSFDRALHSFYAMGDYVMNNNNNNNNKRQSILDTHEDWVIIEVNDQKFKSSLQLGGHYCVHGSLVEHQDIMEIWDVAMRESEDPKSTVFNSARVTVARPDVFVPQHNTNTNKITIPMMETQKDNQQQKQQKQQEEAVTTKDIFRLFRDEFDAHCSRHIPLRNVLTLFERSRSNYLGGPDALQKLKEEHGLLFVVTKINKCCKFEIKDDLLPGQLVLVETTFKVKRNGMIIECYQTLKSNQQQIVAQASVSLMTLDATSFKPSTNLPDWLRDLLKGDQ